MTARDFRHLGAYLRHLRNSQSMTQREVANVLGVVQGKVSAWETNRTLPSPQYLDMYQRRFRLDLHVAGPLYLEEKMARYSERQQAATNDDEAA